MCLAPVLRANGAAPKGQESLAQGLPWASRYKRFALKGLELRTPYLLAPSGLIRVGGNTQGKPWAMLSWPFGPKMKPRANPVTALKVTRSVCLRAF